MCAVFAKWPITHEHDPSGIGFGPCPNTPDPDRRGRKQGVDRRTGLQPLNPPRRASILSHGGPSVDIGEVIGDIGEVIGEDIKPRNAPTGAIPGNHPHTSPKTPEMLNQH